MEVKSLLGEAVRRGGQSRALVALDERAGDLAGALRRSVPALLRRGVTFHPSPARVTRSGELGGDGTAAPFEVPLVTDPGGSRALLRLSASAASYLVDAALGGMGEPDATHAASTTISGPQRAVMTRIAGEMVGAISDVLAGLGLRLRRIPSGPDTPSGVELVMISFQIGDDASRTVLLAMSRDALQASAAAVATARSPDVAPRVANALSQVEVAVVVELGRIRRSLLSLDRLRVGDVVRLDTPIRTPLVVRCEDKPLFVALPTTAGTQLAINIIDRIESGRTPGIAESPLASAAVTVDVEP